MNEFYKYIVMFDLITFLGFSDKFNSGFRKFTKFITSFIKIVCMLQLLYIFLNDLLVVMSLHDDKFKI